jgi:hypothetical protein
MFSIRRARGAVDWIDEPRRAGIFLKSVTHLLKTFGIILMLGGLGHSAGVLHFYAAAGVPDADRVLLDVWIAEAQLLGGSLYLAASSASRSGKPSRAWAIFGALTIIGFTVPLIPVLFSRAPTVFRIPAVIYLLLSIWILANAVRPQGTHSR